MCLKLTPRPFADLTDVTLADEDNNSTPTDNNIVKPYFATSFNPSGEGVHLLQFCVYKVLPRN